MLPHKITTSIIMNCYNSQQFLQEAIDSALNQTYQNWELIFWDNQSTDQSASIIKAYSDSRIKYLYASEHTPLSVARNLAIAKAQGEWVAFLDCDDIWHPEKLEKQIRRFETLPETEKSTVGLIYGNSSRIDENGNESVLIQQFEKQKLPEGNILKLLLLEGDFIPFPTVMIKKKAFESVGGICESYKCTVDYYFLAAICEKHTAIAVQEKIAKYRVHGNNLTITSQSAAYREPLSILEKWGHHIQPEQLKQRKKIYHTLLSVQYLKNKKPLMATKELFQKGSLSYLISKSLSRLQKQVFI